MLGLDLVGDRMDGVGEGVALLQAAHLEVPHEQVHRLAVAERLDPLLVIGRMPRLEDVGVTVIALDQEPDLVVVVKSIGPTSRFPAALADPSFRAAPSSASKTAGSSSASMKPNWPSLPPWYWSQRRST